jgi:sugar phosphate permease
MNFINRTNWFYRLQQLVILILHLVLLRWMFYALTETGVMTTQVVLFHFVGMSIYGAGLIRGCAAWAKYHYEKELNTTKDSSNA